MSCVHKNPIKGTRGCGENRQNSGSAGCAPGGCFQLGHLLSKSANAKLLCKRGDRKIVAVIRQLLIACLFKARQSARNPEKSIRMKVPCLQGVEIECHKSSICRARSLNRDSGGRYSGKTYVLFTNTRETAALQRITNSPSSG